MLITLTLVKSTPSENGGYINTWKTGGEIVNTTLGQMKTPSSRYCTKSLNLLPENTVAQVEMDNFTVSESEPFIGDDGNTHITKWLRLK